MLRASEAAAGPERLPRADVLCVTLLAMLILVSRMAERGGLYFVDGPRIVGAIRSGTFVVQSPGYWAFAHLGGLFRDPVGGLAFWNILFSTLGVPVFYLLCRERQRSRAVCFAAALAYGFTYFAWFAGEIHSSYASQMLFPALGLLCALRWQRSQRFGWLVAWSLAAAIGFALRPSDGVFLLPLWLALLPRFGRAARVWAVFLGIQFVCFLLLYLPTRHALQAAHQRGSGALIVLSMCTVSPLLLGLNSHSLANIARVVAPSLIAFGVLLPALVARRSVADRNIAFFWLVPGLLFFALCYVADPTYMLCLYGGWFWLAITGDATRRAFACLLLCAVLNATMFLAARPVRGDGIAAKLVNFYVVKYTRYGLQHRWSSTLGGGGQVPL